MPLLKDFRLALNGIDFDDRKLLTVTSFVAVALASFLFEDDDFFATLVFEDGGRDGSSFNVRSPDFHIFAFTDCQDRVNGDGIVLIGFREPIDEENVSLLNGVLAALCFDRRFHWKKQATKEALGENASYFLEGFSRNANLWKMLRRSD